MSDTLEFPQPPTDSSKETPLAPNPRLHFELCPQGVGKLIGALAKAHKAFKPVIKNSKNPFYKSSYADLAEVISATADALSENEIAVVQAPAYFHGDKCVEIHTIMAHSSGEWIKSILEMPVSKEDAQGVGSAITYGRRYSYSGILNVASEDDDDGNAAVSDRKYEKEFDERTEGQRLISDYQRNAWESGRQKGIRSDAQIKAYFAKLGIAQIEDMPKAAFNEAIKWLLNPDKELTEPLKESVSQAKKTDGKLNFRRMFALAKEKSIPEPDVKRYAYETFGVESLLNLTQEQVTEVEKWLNLLA